MPEPKLVYRKVDDGRWIIRSISDDDSFGWSFSSRTACLYFLNNIMNSRHEKILFEIDGDSDNNYEEGYEDGLEGTQHSVLWMASRNYRLGWRDGDGDKLYGRNDVEI